REPQGMRGRIEVDVTLTRAERADLADVFRDLKRLSDEYHALAVKLVDASKRMGEAAGVLYALDPVERPGAVLLAPHDKAFDGANVVDIAVFVPAVGGKPAKLVIIESKGGREGKLETAEVYDEQKREWVNAQQGSPEYLRRTLAIDI